MIPEGAVRLNFDPYDHQRAAHLALLSFRFQVLVWHRGAGKTVFSVMELVLGAMQCKHDAGRYAYIAPFLKQAKGAAWDWLKAFTREMPGVVINESELYVQLPNGARIRIFGADNAEALRGFHWDGVVLDEVADMDPKVWFVILRPALTIRTGWVVFIGTPKGVNLFSEIYYSAIQQEDWHAEIRRASETGVISPEEIGRLKKTMSAPQYAQEMDCDFAASSEDALLKLDDVLLAQQRNLKDDQFNFAGKALGVDVARFGGDRTVLTPRQGLACFNPVALPQLDTMATAGRVAQAIDKWKPDAVFIDNGTFGAGVVDRLRQLKYRNIHGIDFGSRANSERFQNKRSEMWWDAAEWVKGGGALANVPELMADLTAPRFDYKNQHGRIELESKDSLRSRGLKSPDFGDSFALTFAMPVAPAGMRGRANTTDHDFDPYNLGGERDRRHTTDHDFTPYGGI